MPAPGTPSRRVPTPRGAPPIHRVISSLLLVPVTLQNCYWQQQTWRRRLLQRSPPQEYVAGHNNQVASTLFARHLPAALVRRIPRKDPCMRKGILAVATAGVVALGGLAACGKSNTPSGGSSGGGKQPYIGVILPDSKTSARWETADRPYLEKAFKDAGVKYDIQNAQGDKGAFQTIADQLLTKGVNVLVIVNLDSGSGKTVLDNARKQGVATIDYDRRTLGGGADDYVSFDNVAVGKLQGEGLVKCLTDMKATKPKVAELNGSPTDNNATLFAQGYNSVLDPKYADGTLVKGPNQSVPDWDNAQAGTIFEQMPTANKDIQGALVANDGMANSGMSILK